MSTYAPPRSLGAHRRATTWNPRNFVAPVAATARPAFERDLEPVVIEQVRQRLASLHDAPKDTARVYFLNVLRNVVDGSSATPSVAADEDGGIVAVWKCGPLSLQVDVNDDQTFYVRVRDGVADSVREWYEGLFPYAQVKDALRDVSKRAHSVNPSWARVHG